MFRASSPDLTCYVLSAFAKLRKAIISVVMFVCPSLRPSVLMELGAHWTDFYEIRYLRISKIFQENSISVKI
jgi:hypothetical protein